MFVFFFMWDLFFFLLHLDLAFFFVFSSAYHQAARFISRWVSQAIMVDISFDASLRRFVKSFVKCTAVVSFSISHDIFQSLSPGERLEIIFINIYWFHFFIISSRASFRVVRLPVLSSLDWCLPSLFVSCECDQHTSVPSPAAVCELF